MLLILLALTIAIILFEHYYPDWHEWVGRKLPDPRRLILNYIIGTLAWFAPYSIWFWFEAERYTTLQIVFTGWLFALTAGCVTALAYREDANREARRKAVEESELRKRVESERSR